jgi:hypothetical protein
MRHHGRHSYLFKTKSRTIDRSRVKQETTSVVAICTNHTAQADRLNCLFADAVAMLTIPKSL